MQKIALSAALVGFVLVTIGTAQDIFTFFEFVFYTGVIVCGSVVNYVAGDI